MNRRIALFALTLFLVCASFAHANFAYRIYEDDPRRTHSIAVRTVVGLAIGSMVLSCFAWFVLSKRYAKVLPGGILLVFLFMWAVAATSSGGETLYLKGDRPPGAQDTGLWDRNPDGTVPQEQAIYPMTWGFLISIGITAAGLLAVRWWNSRTFSRPPVAFGASRSSPDGTTN